MRLLETQFSELDPTGFGNFSTPINFLSSNSTNTQAKYLAVSPKNNEAVVERYQFYKESEALQNVQDNLMNATESRLNEFEKREFQVLRKYFDEGAHNPSV